MGKTITQVDVPEQMPDEEIDETLVTTAPDDWEWDTLAEESPTKIIFDKFGDSFVGKYEGRLTITPDNGDEPFVLLTFRARDENKYAVNSSYKLDAVLTDEVIGKWVRLVYIKDIPTKLNPMKDFRVDIRK